MNDTHIGVIMGSASDYEVVAPGLRVLEDFAVPYELRVVSAHRTPHEMLAYASSAHTRQLKVIIAAAGGAAHLPGMVAAATPLPVIGLPVKSKKSMDGWDSVLSILQMPDGVPVATVALNAAQNAAILALQILATENKNIQKKLIEYKNKLKEKVAAQNEHLRAQAPPKRITEKHT